MLRRWMVLAALLAGCAPANEGELRARPGEHAIYVVPGGMAATADLILARAKACFDGRKINFQPTFVHKEPVAGGGSFLVTVYQLGVYDPRLFAQIDILPDPAGTRVEVFGAGGMMALPKQLGPYVKGWLDNRPECPPILF